MSQWWTYRLSDFLLFAPRTYYRLFELYNAEVWPGQLTALALGLALLVVVVQGRAWAARAACLMLAACWLWVAWAFHLQRYATINWAATWFASVFAIQSVLLLAGGAFGAGLRIRAVPDWRRNIGLGLLLFALAVQPWIGMLAGRSWRQAEVFALAPDPTVLATLAVLLLLQGGAEPRPTPRAPLLTRLLWPMPLLWCLITGATLWTMQSADAWLMPASALLALWSAGCADRARR